MREGEVEKGAVCNLHATQKAGEPDVKLDLVLIRSIDLSNLAIRRILQVC